MKLLHGALILLVPLCLHPSCSKENNNQEEQTPTPKEKDQIKSVAPATVITSKALSQHFPLFPHIEKHLWKQLLTAEEKLLNPEITSSEQQKIEQQIESIAQTLHQTHPFYSDDEQITLGGISYQKATGKIYIPAVVEVPNGGKKDHPDELELILCSNKGRIHETLFVTDTRPLHLELLLHLTGSKKLPKASSFHLSIDLPNKKGIPVTSLLKSTDKSPLPDQLTWQFSGSSFADLYSPDQTGDFIICWHAHDSVLQVIDEKIASGETKLKAVPHPLLEQGTAVKIVLTPIQK